MKKKIIVIGKKSFIGSNLFIFLKKKNFFIKKLNFNEFVSSNAASLKKYDYIINCSVHRNYIEKKYNKKYDFDYIVAKKILKLNCNQIFLSSRKVYKPSKNIKENTKLNPSCSYSKNKIMTEKKLIKILGKRILILRISNLIGLNLNEKRSRKVHNTFINIFLKNVKNNHIYDNKKIYKDFLSIEKFSLIVEKLIRKDAYGIYNVSMGKKIYINQLIYWLNYHNPSKVRVKNLPKKFNKDCFYLNNNSLKKKINVKIKPIELEKYCKKLSKKIFKKK